MATHINPYILCPCESGKKAKFCCLNGKQWNKKPNQLKPLTDITDFTNKKCYAKETKNCTSKISREHFISNNILKGLELNDKVKIIGLPWQEKETYNLLSRSRLVSNILCTYHNKLLSPFDAEMGRLYKIILQFDKEINVDHPKDNLAVFCGEDLEKWMLKTACGFIASKQIHNSGVKHDLILKKEYVDILFNDNPFPTNWGMYFKIPENNLIHKYHSFSFSTLTANNELKAAIFGINNFNFYLVLGQPDNPDSFGIHRPRGIQFIKGNIKKTIEICWQDKKYNQGIFLELKETIKDAPKEWAEYLKK